MNKSHKVSNASAFTLLHKIRCLVENNCICGLAVECYLFLWYVLKYLGLFVDWLFWTAGVFFEEICTFSAVPLVKI